MGRESPDAKRERLRAMREGLAAKFPDKVQLTASGQLSNRSSARSQKRRSKREKGERRPPRPLSLPELAESPEPGARGSPSKQRSASAMGAAPSTARENPKMSKNQQRRFDKAEPMIRRAVREQWRSINLAFKQEDRKKLGAIDEDKLRDVLFRCNIIIEDKHMEQLLYKIDKNGDGMISYAEFLKYFGKGSDEDKDVLSTVRDVSVDDAIEMIRTKIEGRLPGGPAALRRSFQFFDTDGSGGIDHEEFKTALRTRCGLIFEDAFLSQIMRRFDDDGSGVIDYRKFSELVMGSKRGDGTSAQHNNPSLSLGTDDAGTSDQMIRRKIRDQIKTIVIGFKHADLGKSGYISEAALLQVLSNHGVDLSALRLRELQTKVKKEVVSALRLHALCIARLCHG